MLFCNFPTVTSASNMFKRSSLIWCHINCTFHVVVFIVTISFSILFIAATSTYRHKHNFIPRACIESPTRTRSVRVTVACCAVLMAQMLVCTVACKHVVFVFSVFRKDEWYKNNRIHITQGVHNKSIRTLHTLARSLMQTPCNAKLLVGSLYRPLFAKIMALLNVLHGRPDKQILARRI